MPEIDAPKRAKREAFTLLELLIVILLLSLMATLVVGTLSGKKEKMARPGIEALKNLRDALPSGEGELVCLEECDRCLLWDGRTREAQTLPYGFKGLGAYVLDRFGEARRPDFGRYGDRPVCLRFRFRRNGSSSEMILEAKGKFYFFPSYFGAPRSFDSLGEAVDYWRRNDALLRSAWEYF